LRELNVPNKLGIHARPAAMIVRLANKFHAEVLVDKGDEQVDGKSIMGLLILAAEHGSKLRFIASGDDAEDMLDAIAELFRRNFDE
jgi:phosphocarrier protein